LFVIIVICAYFIDISQGNVETHLRWKFINNWRRYGQKWSATFFWPTLYSAMQCKNNL